MAKTYRPRTKKVRAQLVCWEQLNTIRSFLEECKANLCIVFSKNIQDVPTLSVTFTQPIDDQAPEPVTANTGDYIVLSDGFLSKFTAEEFTELYEAVQ